MDQNTGRVREGYNLEYEKVKCFRLEPLPLSQKGNSASSESLQEGRNNVMAIDGERY